MPQVSTNADVQFELAAIEKYINDSITLAFPMITWTAIVSYDSDAAGNIVAVLECVGDIYYNAIFQKGDSNPLLQRFTD